MTKNMGLTDRRVRAFLVAPALLVVAGVAGFGSVGGVVATVLAGVMLGTAAVGTCPVYAPFGLDTRGRSETSD